MLPIDLPKIYNPANQSQKDLIENFVVRTKLYKDIFNDIKKAEMKYPEQHYIIQGVRGQGKTTLLLRIAYQIQKDKEINKRLIPVIFNEEQYNITRLFKLWETVAEYLEEEGHFPNLYHEMQKFENDNDYEIRCWQLLENTLKKNKKKLILFIDNIDELLDKFNNREHQRLREIFIESAEIRVIGASSTSLEFHYDYGKAFYQFFEMPLLKGLSLDETQTLLLSLGNYYKKDQVIDIVKNQQGRIEALRRITGGVIRTIILLFNIFVDDTNGNAFQDLEKILDSVTPLYKHRMDKLPPQQQEIIDFIALQWDAVTVKEIAQKTKLQSKAVSAQLKQLERYHIIEKEKTNTKNYLYRIAERFFNIWYLMRLGRKWDEKRVRFLVEFLQIWCDQKELTNKAMKHLEALKQGTVYEKHALYMTEALARLPIKRDLQHSLITETRTYLKKCQPELVSCLSRSDKELVETLSKISDTEDIQLKIKQFEQIRFKNADELVLLSRLYFKLNNDVDKAKNYLLQAVEKNSADAMYGLALLYRDEIGDIQKAEKYFLMAVEKDNTDAMFSVALLYETEFKDIQKAEKYLLMAVERENTYAMLGLALLYTTEFKDIKKAEKYLLMAVERDNTYAMVGLALLYATEIKDIRKAEDYYLIAVERDNTYAMVGLALLYETEFKDIQKAEKYYLMAVKKGNTNAMNNLALLYEKEFNDIQKAEKYYLMAVEKEDIKAMFNLALLYENEFKDFQKAEKYLLLAVEKDNTNAMNDLAWLYFKQKKQKRNALELVRKSYTKEKQQYISHTYAMVLLWNNDIEKSNKVAKEFITDNKFLENFLQYVRQYLQLLIAKKQYHFALKLFNESPNQLKDRFKPIYYALMYFMQDEYPNEYRKMGGELKQTVEEIISEINQMEIDYR